MVPFVEIFCVAMLINVVLALRSNGYFWNKIISLLGYETPSNPVSQQESLLALEGDGTGNQSTTNESSAYKTLLIRYLVVYMLAALSDWLQGPYVYQLYSKYGFSQHDIAVLFVAGFGSSMVFGSFIGGLADSCGRKKFTLLFCLIYILSCVTKHFKHYNILMVGRILGGIATSLLFSVFDSWLIKAHADARLSSYLSQSFSWMQFVNSCVAIVSGLIANKAANSNELKQYNPDSQSGSISSAFYVGGLVNPFDLALIALILCAIGATFLWEENYGTAPETLAATREKKNVSSIETFQNAYSTIMRKTELFYCGLICAFFEGSMYIFVFMWTPSMKNLTKEAGEDESTLPFGFIFSTFMVFAMAGSTLFSIMVKTQKIEKLGTKVFAVATVAFIFMALSKSASFTFLSFNLFEMCVGMYFPIMGTLKSSIVPEDQRSAIYNIFRIPLNVIVLMSLLTDIAPTQSFTLCTGMMGLSTYFMVQIDKIQSLKSVPKEKDNTTEIDPEMQAKNEKDESLEIEDSELENEDKVD